MDAHAWEAGEDPPFLLPAAVSSPHFPTFMPVAQCMSVTSPIPGPDRRQGSIINKLSSF